MMSMMNWGMMFNMILWILIVGLIIYAVLRLFSKPFEKKEDSAYVILRERFARGDISEEEYEQRKLALQRDTGKSN
jgi:putative membrane protein